MFPMGEFHIAMFGTMPRIAMTVWAPLFCLAMSIFAIFKVSLNVQQLFKMLGAPCKTFANLIWLCSESSLIFGEFPPPIGMH